MTCLIMVRISDSYSILFECIKNSVDRGGDDSMSNMAGVGPDVQMHDGKEHIVI